MSGSRLHAVFLAFAAAAPLCAQSTPPMVEAALRNRFGFLGPKVHKIGDGINLMRCVDLDADGDDEIVVNHGARGRLTVLTRKEHGAIEQEFVDTDGTIYGLAAEDVNGDSTIDWVMYGSRGRLVVRTRGDDPKSLPSIEVGNAATYDAVRVGDVDRDGKPDAVALTREGVRVVYSVGHDAVVSPTMALDFERVRSFLLDDLDGDGNLDVAVVTTRPQMPLHVKFGTGTRSFGPWVLFRSPLMHRAFVGPGIDGKPTLSVVQDRRARIVDYRLRHAAIDRSIAPQMTSVHAIKRGAFPFAHGDVDGDGDMDLVLAHTERAELTFLLEDGGRFETRTVPSLAGITSIALGDHDQDGKVDVLLASGEEEAVAWKSGAKPLDAFPERLPAVDKPLAVAFEADGSVLFLSKDKKRQGKLHRVAHGSEKAEELGALGRFSGDPQRMMLVDVDPTPGAEVVFVVPSDGLRVVRMVDGKAELVASGSSAGFSKKVEDGALSVVSGGDGGDALMIVRNRFARVFRLDAAGEVQVREQLNGPTDGGELAFGGAFGGGRTVFVDSKNNKLYVASGDAAPTSYDLPPFGVTHLLEHHGAALMVGRSGVVRMPFDSGWRLDALRDHEPPTDDTNYWLGAAADFDSDGSPDLALLDEDINGVQILVATADKLHRALGFPVFELPEKSDTVYEPREIAIGDWDGDGHSDLVLISHDRVLVYRQEN